MPDLPINLQNYLYKFANSSIDVYDGLFSDLKKLTNRQSYGSNIYLNLIPISKNLKTYIDNNSCKLYDLHHLNKYSYGIIKVKLIQYKVIINKINSFENSSTISSSGKIRLIRERMEKITTK